MVEMDRKLEGLVKLMEKCLNSTPGGLHANHAFQSETSSSLTMFSPVTISSQANIVSTSPALTTTANTNCNNIISYVQSVPRSVSSTGHNLYNSFVTGMPFFQSYFWPAAPTGPSPSTGCTYTSQRPTFFSFHTT